MSTTRHSDLPIIPDEGEPLVHERRRAQRERSMTKRMKKWRCCACYFCWSCFLTTVIAVAVGACFTLIQSGVESFVAQQVVLLDGATSTDQFANPPVPIYAQFTFFNITNPEEFQNGSKVQVEEVGPFAYLENKTKFNMVWSEDENILRYHEGEYYYFNESMSSADPHDVNITTINLPLIGVAGLLRQAEAIAGDLPSPWNETAKALIAELYKSVEDAFNESLFITKTAHELLWGYQDNLLEFAASLTFLSSLGLPVPPSGLFGLQVNESVTGPNMVWTGKNDIKLTASYLMWNGSMDIDKWGTPYAGMLNGTEGLLFAPNLDKNDTVVVFVDQLFRSGYFTFSSEETVQGIKTFKYILPKEELASRNQDPGFSPYGPDGVLNLTAVFPLNVPIFASKPHFLDADPIYAENVSGMNPDPSKHDSYLSIEPKTGAVMDVEKRLQFSVQVKRTDDFPDLANLRSNTLVPILWAQEAATINETLAEQFQDEVYTPVNAVKYGSIAVVVAFGVLAVITCLLLFVTTFCYLEEKWKWRGAGGGNVINLHTD